MIRIGCQHELVETGKAGEVPVYRCRLCGATLRGRKKETRTIRLWKLWFQAIAFLGMSCGVFFALALSGFSRGEVFAPKRFGPDIWIQRSESPGMFWACMVLYLGFSIGTLAVSIWQFRGIIREMRGESPVV